MSKHSTSPTPTAKPERPPGSPLFWHATGRWAKKIRGRLHYFGRGSHDEALALYQQQAADLHAGRRPADTCPDTLTVYALCAKFLTAKKDQREQGELGPRTFREYADVCKRLIRSFGRDRAVSDLGRDDFARLRKRMAKTWGPVRLKAEIIRSRTPFLWAAKSGLIDRTPVWGEAFKVPAASVIRRDRADRGPKMLEADELRRLIGQPPWAPAADGRLRAAVLLALNCGFGNGDVAALPIGALDLDRGWVSFPRPKTGIERRCPLWPETTAALKWVLDARPTPGPFDALGRVFLSARGTPILRLTDRNRTDGLAVAFSGLLKRLGMHRPGLGFYTLRHVHRTVADGARDPVACNVIMGHSDPTMGGHYRQRVEDARLNAVVNHVRGWLFGEGKS